MSCYSEIWPIMATFDTAWSILINFIKVCLKWLRMSYDANEWQTLHNMASNGPVWPVLVIDDQFWSRISSMNEIVHLKAELRNLGLTYQIMVDMALWYKIEQIWLKVAYKSPVYALVSRYVKLWPYLSLYYQSFDQFWQILSGLMI